MDEKEIWVFLSHSNEDYDKVRRVRNMLEEQDMRPIMFFLKCLNDDDEIDGLIKREIDCRTRFILCDSENARRSKWVQREIEYIRSQQKPYEVIDLSLKDDRILDQLKEVRRKSRLFISYARADIRLAERIYERLRKYDYNLFADFMDIGAGDLFANKISRAIKSSVKDGYVIALLTEAGAKSAWVTKEIMLAAQYDSRNKARTQSVIPVVFGNSLSSASPEVRFCVAGMQYVNLPSGADRQPDVVVDAILKTLLKPGEILTYYRNFRDGVNQSLDKFEAERLGKILWN